MPSQPVSSTPPTPACLKVGRSGTDGSRYGLLTARPLIMPDLICSMTTGNTSMSRSIEPPHEIVERRGPAAIGHVHHAGAGRTHEQLDREIVERAGAGRAEGELTRPRLGVVDEFL